MSDGTLIPAVVLAAGASSRFGAGNKLLADAAGTPVIVRCVRVLLEAGLKPVHVVVAGDETGAAVADALGGVDVEIVRNADADRGIGASVACGVASVPETRSGLLIVPGDMPALDAGLVAELMQAARASGFSRIVYPVTLDGAQRNPVIWPAWLRADLLALDGDTGAKALITAHREHALPVPPGKNGDTRMFQDIDTAEDLARFNAQARDSGDD